MRNLKISSQKTKNKIFLMMVTAAMAFSQHTGIAETSAQGSLYFAIAISAICLVALKRLLGF